MEREKTGDTCRARVCAAYFASSFQVLTCEEKRIKEIKNKKIKKKKETENYDVVDINAEVFL